MTFIQSCITGTKGYVFRFLQGWDLRELKRIVKKEQNLTTNQGTKYTGPV